MTTGYVPDSGTAIREFRSADVAETRESGENLYLDRSNLTADQIQFINQIINNLVSDSIVDPGRLTGARLWRLSMTAFAFITDRRIAAGGCEISGGSCPRCQGQ